MAVKPTKASTRTTSTPTLSVVVPLFNEAKGLPGLHERIAEVARYLQVKRGLNLEIVYVDDGSSDGTSGVAKSLPAIPLDFQVVTLSRNFGKEAALLAGLDHARP
ncbi:MAG: glycosyltransferase, partial [Pseudolabrys sp.]